MSRLDDCTIWLGEAEPLVSDVDGILGRPRGIRIGEAPSRFDYLVVSLFALARLGDLKPEHPGAPRAAARDLHPAFVAPGRGIIWKMKEDLSGPYPGDGLGAMDAYDGYVSYRRLRREGFVTW